MTISSIIATSPTGATAWFFKLRLKKRYDTFWAESLLTENSSSGHQTALRVVSSTWHWYATWWLIPLSKWVITPVINGISRVNPLITRVITHLRAVGSSPPSTASTIEQKQRPRRLSGPIPASRVWPSSLSSCVAKSQSLCSANNCFSTTCGCRWVSLFHCSILHNGQCTYLCVYIRLCTVYNIVICIYIYDYMLYKLNQIKIILYHII